jgi:ribosomal protein S19E (S16A)
MHRYWMGELFVNIMLHTYVAEKRPELLPALEAFPNMVVGAGTAEYKYTSLEDFEKLYATLGMGPKNYGWYQCKLHSAARDIYNAGGKEVMKKLWNALKEHQDQLTDPEFVNMLKTEVHPSVADVYLKWE